MDPSYRNKWWVKRWGLVKTKARKAVDKIKALPSRVGRKSDEV